MKLEKVGKRIKRIISEDSSGDEADAIPKQCKAEIKAENDVDDPTKKSDNSMKMDATPKCKSDIKIEVSSQIEKPESQEISVKVLHPFSPSPSVSALPTPPPTASKPTSAISKLPRM